MTVAAQFNLEQTLSEMDVALEDEIEAQGSKLVKHVVINGKSLGEQNGLYLYDFTLQSPWTPQDDTPVSIRTSKTPAVVGTIIKATGIGVLVSFEKSLTQEELQKLDIYSDATELTRRLRAALKNAKDGEQHLASKCFGLMPFQKDKRELKDKLSLFGLDDSQESAVHMALGSEVTYIIGPPGTGKTYTIAAVAYAYMSEGRSVLIAAHTNIAVDNAIKRLVKSCDEKKLNLKEGQAVRFGVTKALDEPPYNKAYIPAIIERRTNTLSARKEKIVARFEQIRVEKLAWQQEKQQGLPTWETQRLQLITQRDVCKNALIPLLNHEKQRIAVIDAQIRQAEERLRNAQREIENVKQTLAQTVNQQVQLKSVRMRHVSTANESAGTTEIGTNASCIYCKRI